MKRHLGDSKNWKRLANRFWQDERGQSTTEYILILSVVVMVAMKFKSTFMKQMDAAVNKFGSEMDQAMSDQ
jgi:Flp pilus assembly pilin Flp